MKLSGEGDGVNCRYGEVSSKVAGKGSYRKITCFLCDCRNRAQATLG